MPDPLDIIPFRFLRPRAREAVRSVLVRKECDPGTPLVHQDDDAHEQVFLLTAGSVEVVDHHDRHRVTIIEKGHYFGERAALFGQRRSFDVNVLEPSEVWEMPGSEFLRLIAEEPAFAAALSHILRNKQGIFSAFDRFLAELEHGASRGHIIIPRLLHLYLPLLPALHRGANDTAIDFAGLSYAVRRLPDNLTTTLTFFLTNEPPFIYGSPDVTFTPVETAARRRAVYEMLPGKSLVLLRDGLSDLVDFVTCLCLYAFEARKIRRRLQTPAVLRNLCDGCAEDLPFSEEETRWIRKLWPDETQKRLYEIAVHHEDFAVSVFHQRDNYNSAHSETWTHQIAVATRKLMGKAPHELDIPVHIVSSNTHSVTNCLSGFLAAHADDIVRWGERYEPGIIGLDWHNRQDLVMALSRAWLKANPEQAVLMKAVDEGEGVEVLRETAFTGIGVQLFDTLAIQKRPIDASFKTGKQALIVNIDYAFGQQADHIIGALISLFGPLIESINVLGKAGGLQGRRGDIMIATALLEQRGDLLRTPEIAVDIERLKGRAPGIDVHVGPMLTVMGTLLQNEQMLQFYKHVWGCVGLEMEGSYYCREIEQSQRVGTLPSDVAVRYLYYTSDLPLLHDATLAEPMKPNEGIPPLYAITREVLTGIFEG